MITNQINCRSLIYCLWISGIIFLLTLFYLLSPTYAQNQNDSLFSVGSSPYGKPYKYWAQKWWEWNLAFNSSNHPNVNYTDKNCAMGQKEDSPVWYLVQPFPGEDPNFDRTCTIPHGKAIITAIQAGDCNYGELETKTDEALVNCAKIGNEYTKVDEVTIDNKTYKDYQVGRRVLSDFFNVSIIPENIMNYKNHGTFKAIVDGYYVFIKPLTPGKHILHTKFETTPPQGPLKEYETSQEGTWNLIIK